MTGLIARAFERYGMTVTVEGKGASAVTKAFVQPVTRESASEPFTVTPLGAADERVWRYLGPAETPVEMGDRVSAGGTDYRVRSAAAVYEGEEIVCYRAAIVPEVGG